MALTDRKVSASNYKPKTLNGARIVHATQFNELIDDLDDLALDSIVTDLSAIDTRIDALEAIVDDGAVTQATSITTGVTLNKQSGVITTVSSTLAAQGSATFTVTNSTVTASSVVLVSANYGGAGIAVASVNAAPGSGSFVVRIDNAHGTNALNGVIRIHFVVL